MVWGFAFLGLGFTVGLWVYVGFGLGGFRV